MGTTTLSTRKYHVRISPQHYSDPNPNRRTETEPPPQPQRQPQFTKSNDAQALLKSLSEGITRGFTTAFNGFSDKMTARFDGMQSTPRDDARYSNENTCCAHSQHTQPSHSPSFHQEVMADRGRMFQENLNKIKEERRRDQEVADIA